MKILAIDPGTKHIGLCYGKGIFVMLHSTSKYHNRKTEYNGVLYDSKKEAAYARDLDLLLRAKEIQSWERQVPLKIVVNGMKICTYYADFKILNKDGSVEHHDAKGILTPVYKLKKKLVKAVHGIEIKEV